MPIDVDRALGAAIPPMTGSWGPDDVILYHLGIGAGVPPTDANELQYTYEADLKVLPSFGVLPAFPALVGMAGVDGLDYDMAMVLHGEQDLEIHRVPPTAAQVTTSGRITGIYDKGKAALIVAETETVGDDGETIFVNRFSTFVRGEGGFGGEPGPKTANEAPDRAPDHVVESPTLPQQALLYRLCGDKNPLHADPAFAALGGFDTPILHGLCTYGVVCKAVVDTVLGGDTTGVSRYQVRFAGVVFPGETIVTSMWRTGDTIVVRATTKERGEPVITNAAVTLRPS